MKQNGSNAIPPEESDSAFYGDLWFALTRTFHVKRNATTFEFWEQRLRHVPRRILFKAVESICNNEDKMPSLAMILRYVRNMTSFTNQPRHFEGVDRNGVRCWYWEDKPSEPTYGAKDCPEGRAYLALLEEYKECRLLNSKSKR